ncbi:hypothetical protein M0R45_012467 [Rubus argutus]|uniref:Brf1 TBP-binding domain-containing protein n=1 Tax=Rubus argutus TaxID=59490 RepID=A0AAW1YCS5_RUBAR
MAFRKRSEPRQKQQADSQEGSGDSSDHVSESLSDIDDAEISPYLNTDKEVLYKTIVWEAMNRDDIEKTSTRKRAGKAKEAGPLNKSAKTCTESMDNNTKKSRPEVGNHTHGVKKQRSSKINYGALNEEAYGFEEHCEEVQGYDDDSESEHLNEEDQYKPGYNDDNDTYDYANDDYNGYNDGEDYGFDEF